ncbi:MAG: DNA polymerase III subunit delta' [SAR202 cluster bacterium]|nr:DNA polymerase III subunit delta' [SAR202 cluster bacterium]
MFRVHGHALAVRYFERSLREGRLHHAYLLAGPAHVGKMTLALQLAAAAECEGVDPPCGTCKPCRRVASGQHADVRVIAVDPTGGEDGKGPRTQIGIDAVHDAIGAAHLRPYEGKRHVFIVQDADRMSADAANALLKLLEEPPPDVLFLLLSTDAPNVLPTVRSRCALVDLKPLPVAEVARVLREEHHVDAEHAESLARLSRGCIGWAIEASQGSALLAAMQQRLEKIADIVEGDLETRFAYADELARRFQRDRAAGRDELYLWLRWLRDIMLTQQDRGDGIAHLTWRDTLARQAAAFTPAQVVRWLHGVLEVLEDVDRNVNTRLALEVMLLEAPAVAPAASA